MVDLVIRANSAAGIFQPPGIVMPVDYGSLALAGQDVTLTPSGGTANPLFSSLDMADIPFHNGAGAWGSQVAFQTASPPNITSSSNASTFSELQTAMGIPGRRVTVTANIIGGNINIAAVTDVEVVVPNGILLNGIVWGNGVTGTVWNRCRWIKATGDTIGGQIHNFRMLGASISDWILDGLQISGSASGDGLAIYPGTTSGSPTRGAVLRNRINAEAAMYGYGGTHFLVAGNSGRHDFNNTDDFGDWGFRNGAGDASNGPYIYFGNDFRGERYAKIRFHPSASGSPFYAYVASNTFVDRVENRSMDCNDTGSSTGYPDIDAVWFRNNSLYVSAGGGMGMQRFDSSATCNYVEMTNNTVNGAASYLTTGGAATSIVSGNSENAAPGVDPGWGGAGDPTGIDTSP